MRRNLVLVKKDILRSVKYLFISMRPQQWIRNILIFLPLIFGKKLFVSDASLKTAMGFLIFSLATGAVYIINDILDFKKDAFHPTKCLRPIASGKVAIRQAWTVSYILIAVSTGLSFLLNINFTWIIIYYYLLNFIYTSFLKNLVIIDVLCIANFYLIRIIAGIVIAEVAPSIWIIFITVLLAMFVALTKRRQEFVSLKDRSTLHRSVLARYNLFFVNWTIAIITILIFIMYTLYAFWPTTVEKFKTTHMAYSIPFVYGGIARYLYLSYKSNKEWDPLQFIFSDRIMQFNLMLWLIICIAVIYFKF